MRRRGIGLAVAALIGFAGATAWALDEVTFEASVDKNKVAVTETVQYLVVVHYGLETMAPTITPPSFDQFTVLNEYQNSQESAGEGEKHMILKKLWQLRPNEPGRLSISAAIVSYQDPTSNLLRTGKTNVQFVVAEQASGGTAAPAGNTAAARTRKLLGLPWPWLAGLLAGLAVVLALALARLLRPRAGAPAASRRSPEDAALAELAAAVADLEKNNEALGEYYARLTRALLDYLQNKYGLDANVLATPDLLAQLARLGFSAAVRGELEAFFQTADKTKFAGYLPGEDEMIALHGTVTRFIESGRSITRRP